jgi:hypothetical protein
VKVRERTVITTSLWGREVLPRSLQGEEAASRQEYCGKGEVTSIPEGAGTLEKVCVYRSWVHLWPHVCICLDPRQGETFYTP